MQCIKCGRETGEQQVFCESCLSAMEKSPVKPGTPVVIQKRPQKLRAAPAVKKEKPEEQLLKLQRLVKILLWLCVGLVLALALSVGMLAYHFTFTDHSAPAIGQNYSTEAPDDAPLSR